jgi:hypothetical protein
MGRWNGSYSDYHEYGDYWTSYAMAQIESTYGHIPRPKPKTLNKFGRTENADDGVKTTIAKFQDAVVNETFSTTNDIDRIVSTSGSDTEVIKVEGHYYDADNNLVFHVQEATLTGQTAVALSQSLCRATRAYVKAGTFASPASDLVGTVAVFRNGATTAGKPNTDTDVVLMISGATSKNQSEKCATATSYVDYWVITSINCGLERSGGATVAADFELEWREQGGVWRHIGPEMTLRTAATDWDSLDLRPYIVIPPNSDIRMVVTSNTNDTSAEGFIGGFLAITDDS